jgi:diacylglycerol kinase (ATP)
LIRLAASVLAGGTTVLGVVAAGTGNDAARALNLLDGSLEEQVQWALADPVPIDLVVGSGQPVVTSAVCGFPTTVNERANRMRFPKGASRYTLATLLEIPRMTPAHYRLVLDGEALEIGAAAIVVANTAYFGGGMRICPEADPTDGLIDVCVIGDLGRLDLLRSLQQVRTGRHVDHPKVAMYRAGVVGVEGVGTIRADGEPLGDLPVVLRADPGALLVAGATTAAPGRR